MRVNLLPQDINRAKQINVKKLVFLSIMLILVGSMAFAYWHLNREVENKRQALAAMDAVHNELLPVQSKVQSLEAGRKALAEAQSQRGYLLQGVYPSDLLAELTQIIPSNVTVTDITVTDGGAVQIKAQGPTPTSAAQLLSQLGKSRYLAEPKVSSIKENGTRAYLFELSGRLGKEASLP